MPERSAQKLIRSSDIPKEIVIKSTNNVNNHRGTNFNQIHLNERNDEENKFSQEPNQLRRPEDLDYEDEDTKNYQITDDKLGMNMPNIQNPLSSYTDIPSIPSRLLKGRGENGMVQLNNPPGPPDP